jgi:hypothetical protein
VNSKPIIAQMPDVIVDTGDPKIRFPSEVVREIHEVIPGATEYEPEQWQFPCNETRRSNITVTLDFGGQKHNLPMSNIVGPRINESDICSSLIYSGNGYRNYLGIPFLWSYYSVFQYDPPAVGFASVYAWSSV